LMDVFEPKLAIIKRTVASWAHYAFHDEDMALRSQEWVERYKNTKIREIVASSLDQTNSLQDKQECQQNTRNHGLLNRESSRLGR
jgi:hypothetical protein